MTASSSFPSLIRRALGLLCFGMAWLGGSAHAVDGTRSIERYSRRQWSTAQGLAAGRVNAVAQTPDGYLWVGTDRALLRFDGIRFTSIQPTRDIPFGHVTALTVDSSGALWISTEDARLLRYADGQFTPELSRDRGKVSVTAVGRALDNGVLAASLTEGVVHLSGPAFDKLPIATTSIIIALAQTTDGTVFIGTRESGLLAWRNRALTAISQGIPDAKINCLLPTPDGRLWIGTDNGLALWDGRTATTTPLPPGMSHLQILTMVQDRDANLWIGTSHGLLRLNAPGAVWLPRSARNRDTAVTALFEDREGDIWFGDGQNLERIRDTALITYGDAEHLPGDQYGPTFADAVGRIWFAPLAGGLFWRRDGITHRVALAGLDTDVVYSIDGNADDLWLGRQQGGLTRLHLQGIDTFTAQTWTTAQGLAQNSVYAVRVAHDGSVWAGTLTNGISRLSANHIANFDQTTGLLSNTISAIEEDQAGTLWIATPNGVNTLSHGTWTTIHGLPTSEAASLLTGPSGGMWIGTAAGLAYAESGRVRSFASIGSLRESILGMAADAHGSLWLATPSHILSVSQDLLLHDQATAWSIRSYTMEDGLQSAEGVRRARSVVAGPDGRVWITTNSGLSVTSPSAANQWAPALAHIEGIASDGQPLPIAGAAAIPPGTHRLTVDYAGLYLRNPEQVRFRYRLDGFDKGWSEPVSDHQAVYTNLPPGSYRFRVMAFNEQEAWGAEESTLSLHVEPFLWQRRPFQLICLVALLFFALWLYHRRLRFLIAQTNLRAEERLIERTRIARELHDTLLQGFISASMHLDLTTASVPAESPARKGLQQVLEVMERVIEEARLAVLGLRTLDGADASLEHRFRELIDELGGPGAIHYTVDTQGDGRTLRPTAYEEILHIGREAILNAARHANPSRIAVVLKYGPATFDLEVVDDGRGMSADTLIDGRDGHWGIAGMRERAVRVDASLHITSRPGMGTNVLLCVPAAAAYFNDPTL